MVTPETVIKGTGNQQKATSVNQFIRTVSKMLHPGDFYEGLLCRNGYTSPLIFLLLCSILFVIPCSIFVVQKRMFFALMFFFNAFSMPFIAAFILYLVTSLFCKGRFSYSKLFGITAYANVTLLISWIPGLAGPTEILKFFMIGLGMVKVGQISSLKAFMCIFAGAAILLFLIHFVQPILSE
jgi:hypothetical protein